MKDERIKQLESRVEETSLDSSQLRDELAALKKQNEKLKEFLPNGGSGTTRASPSLMYVYVVCTTCNYNNYYNICTYIIHVYNILYNVHVHVHVRRAVEFIFLSVFFFVSSRTYSPREINRLREQAADGLRVREKMLGLQQDVRCCWVCCHDTRIQYLSLSLSLSLSPQNSHLTGELMEAKHILQKHETTNQRLGDRIQVSLF